ncbi:MAG: hypothetical protein ACRCUY_04295, partial [Thermoguttaceae bacterium]
MLKKLHFSTLCAQKGLTVFYLSLFLVSSFLEIKANDSFEMSVVSFRVSADMESTSVVSDADMIDAKSSVSYSDVETMSPTGLNSQKVVWGKVAQIPNKEDSEVKNTETHIQMASHTVESDSAGYVPKIYNADGAQISPKKLVPRPKTQVVQQVASPEKTPSGNILTAKALPAGSLSEGSLPADTLSEKPVLTEPPQMKITEVDREIETSTFPAPLRAFNDGKTAVRKTLPPPKKV